MSNRRGKAKEVIAEMITASTLIHTNMSAIISIPDNISFTTSSGLSCSGLWNKELRN